MTVHFTATRKIEPPHVTTADALTLHNVWRDHLKSHCINDELTNLPWAKLAFCVGDLMLLACQHGDYQYLHYGDNIARLSGFDMTGRWVSEFDSDVAAFFKKYYDLCVQEQQPVHTIHQAALAALVHRWERLILPLFNAANEVAGLLVFNRPCVTKADMMASILDSSHSGIAGLEPITDGDGGVQDYTIITANRRACDFFKGPIDRLEHKRLFDYFPSLQGGVLDQACARVVGSSVAETFELELPDKTGSVQWFRVSVDRSGDALTLTVSDITALKLANLALAQEVERRGALEIQLRYLASTDSLTGLANRRCFFERFEEERSRANRNGRPLILMMIDADNFKTINDEFGHNVGDQALVNIANCLRNSCRSSDIAGRLGGEEFGLLLVEAAADTGARIAERLRSQVEAIELAAGSEEVKLSISIGIAVSMRGGDSVEVMLQNADRALYEAKKQGRNCIRFAEAVA